MLEQFKLVERQQQLQQQFVVERFRKLLEFVVGLTMPNPQPPLTRIEIEKFRWETAARFIAARIQIGVINPIFTDEMVGVELTQAVRLADQLIAELSKPPNEDPDF